MIGSRCRDPCVFTLVCALLAVGGCATADYADGVDSFSQAISQASSTEQTLAASSEQVLLADYVHDSAGHDAVVDFSKCRGIPGPYKAGDCVLEVNGKAPPTVEPSSMTGLTKYAGALSGVVGDRTWNSLQSDADNIASAVTSMATDAKHPEMASNASPLATIASTVACAAIDREQLAILREATKDANPVIQKLVPVIADKDQAMYMEIIDEDLRQLDHAAPDYNTTKSASSLTKVIALTKAADAAQALQPGALIRNIGTLHQALTDELQAPKVDLKTVAADAQALATQAAAVRAAVDQLSQATATSAATAPAAPVKGKANGGKKKPPT